MAEIHIGVFIPIDSQFLDCACVDVFGCMSQEYLQLLPDLPAHLIAAAPHMKFYYITTPENKAKGFFPMTSGLRCIPTHDINDVEVQPGKLDIVYVPGPDPRVPLTKEAGEFLRKHAEDPTTDILSVCTGIYVCGAAGILKGRKASGPRALQADIAKKFPGVILSGDKLRWEHDGNFWSSGGITNGNDMVAAYARQYPKIASPVAEIACKMADVGDRAQVYGESTAVWTLSFVWQLFRAWFSKPKSS